MDSYSPITPLWDLSQASNFSQLPDDDFLALLQKQFPSGNNGFDANFNNGINPQSISRYPLPSLTPPSEDSSPSPPSMNDSNKSSPPDDRDDNDAALKRKASDEDLEEGPSQKNQHTLGNKKGATSTGRRKSSGAGGPDDNRLLKRKEQNRAAQRAFRERKERHVHELEERVAELEKLSNNKESENAFLRNQVERLQNEVSKRQSHGGRDDGSSSTTSLNNSPFTFDYPFVHQNSSSSISSAFNSSMPSLSHADSPEGSATSSSQSPFNANEDSFVLPTKKKVGSNSNSGSRDPAIFDPDSPDSVLFHDYREPLFDDPLLEEPFMASPPADVVKDKQMQFLNCNKLWDKIAAHPDFEQIDIDGLCGELRSKAKCSESGVVIQESDFDTALKTVQAKKATVQGL